LKHLDRGKLVETDKRDPRGGYALGRAFLRGMIDADELAALRRYTEIYLRHAQHVTGKLPAFPCQGIEDGAKGNSCGADMPDDDVFALRRQFADMQTALADTFDWHGCAKAIYNVGLMDRDVGCEVEARALKLAGAALNRLWS
jgi:hypothetical protein